MCSSDLSSMLAVKRGNVDMLVFSDLVGWTYALDAARGTEVWRTRPEEHEGARLTGAVSVWRGGRRCALSQSAFWTAWAG